MSENSILTPTNSDHLVYLDNKTFKSPLHYLYYYTYTTSEAEKEKVLKAPTVDVLLGYGFQLKSLQLNKAELNELVYTLIMFLYCTYEDFRKEVMKLRRRPRPKINIVNDSYYGFNKEKYAKALKTFSMFIA